MGTETQLQAHFTYVVKALLDGRLAPFFGAGVNCCDRIKDSEWKPGVQFLPTGWELAKHLAENYGYPASEPIDLVRVTQFIATSAGGSGALYSDLHNLFDSDYPLTPLHHFFAGVPGLMRKHGQPVRYQLILTANYDDLMERAFEAAGEPHDVVAYLADGENKGKFMHCPCDGKPILIEKPNKYIAVSTERRPVILKVHGAVGRLARPAMPGQDSFVITEDDYIDYLGRMDISSLVPVKLRETMVSSNFLFLGYGLRDWNLRAILHRIWGEQRRSYSSWAVQLNADPMDKKFWDRRGVEIYEADLGQYVAGIQQKLLDALSAKARTATNVNP